MNFSQEQIDDTIIPSDIVTSQIENTIVCGLKYYFPINDNNSRFDLVEIKTTHTKVAPTPHCKIHGAMNCVAIHINGRLWRCIQSCQLKDCRAGCEEKHE
jgi:hypothetical protein